MREGKNLKAESIFNFQIYYKALGRVFVWKAVSPHPMILWYLRLLQSPTTQSREQTAKKKSRKRQHLPLNSPNLASSVYKFKAFIKIQVAARTCVCVFVWHDKVLDHWQVKIGHDANAIVQEHTGTHGACQREHLSWITVQTSAKVCMVAF